MVFIGTSEKYVRDQNESRSNPSNDGEPKYTPTLLDERFDQKHSQKGSFAKHPEVCGKHKVSCKHMKYSAPEFISRPVRWVEENVIVPMKENFAEI